MMRSKRVLPSSAPGDRFRSNADPRWSNLEQAGSPNAVSAIMRPKHLTRVLCIVRPAAALAALLPVSQFGTISIANEIVTIDRLVSHKSTVPAVAGKSVDLFVREKVLSAILNAPGGKAQPGKVALFVHGGFNPATLAFDVAYRDYS